MVQFYRRISIETSGIEDKFYLVTGDNGSQLVEHIRWQADAYGTVVSTTHSRVAVSEFLAGPFDNGAQAALIHYLDADKQAPK
jgi:hypothetical protein